MPFARVMALRVVAVQGLTVDGKIYAVPFYTESSFTLYRKEENKLRGWR